MTEYTAQQEFARLFAEVEQPLYGFVFSLLPNRADADDVVQETVGLLWEHFSEFDASRPFFPWACKFAYRQVLKHRRQGRTHRRHFREAVIAELAEAHPQQSAWDDSHRRAVAHCLARLNERDRKVVFARYFGDSTLDALSATLGRTANSLYKQLQRSRSKLLECVTRQLAKEGWE